MTVIESGEVCDGCGKLLICRSCGKFRSPTPAQACAVRLEARPADNSKEWTEIFPAQLEWVAKEGHQVRAIELAAQPLAAPVETDDYTWYDAYNKLSAAYMGLIAERDAGAQCSANSELLPCPFCGGEPSWTGDYETKLGNVSCENTDCFGPKTTAARYDDAAVQWNTRIGGKMKPIYVKRWRTLFMVPSSLATEIRDTLRRLTLDEPQTAPVPWESLTAIIRPMIESVCSDGNSDAARLAKDIADRILASLSLSRPQLGGK